MRSAAAIILVLLLAGMGSQCAMAQSGNHGDGHAERHDWYKELKQPENGWSCCNGTTEGDPGDCRPVRAYYDSDTNRWKAFVDGQWLTVPPEVILPDKLNREPFTAHACLSKYGKWYCFLRKQGGT